MSVRQARKTAMELVKKSNPTKDEERRAEKEVWKIVYLEGLKSEDTIVDWQYYKRDHGYVQFQGQRDHECIKIKQRNGAILRDIELSDSFFAFWMNPFELQKYEQNYSSLSPY